MLCVCRPTKFLAETDYLPSIRRWVPDLLDEVRGIAAGAGQNFEEMLLFQLMDEYWFHGPAVLQKDASDSKHVTGPAHCTTVAIGGAATSGGAVVAQNMDLESLRDGAQCVLKLSSNSRDGDPAQLLFSHAGMLALCGVKTPTLTARRRTYHHPSSNRSLDPHHVRAGE